MELSKRLTIQDLEQGAVLERMEHELMEVLEDCADINKVADSVREITCKIKIKPDMNRCVLTIGIETGTKMGKRHPVLTKAFMDDTGQAFEPRAKQVDLFSGEQDNITVIGGGKREEKSNG